MANLSGFLALGSIDASGSFVELTGAGSYARRGITLVPDASGLLAPSADITFPAATGANWPKISALAVYDAAASGSLLFYWAVPAGDMRSPYVGGPALTIRQGRLQLDFLATGGPRSSHGTPIVEAVSLIKTPFGVSRGGGSSQSSGPKAKAQRLINLMNAAARATVMASPPTTTLSAANAATSIAGGVLIPPNNYDAFQYLGTVVAEDTNNRVYPAHVRVKNGSGVLGREGKYWFGKTYRVRFQCTASVFEFRFVAQGLTFRIFVDGQAISATPVAPGSDFSFRNYKVDFGTAASRAIDIEIAGGQVPWFGGIYVPAGYTVYKPAQPDPLRLIFQADSYHDNGGGYAASYLDNPGVTVLRALGVGDAWLVSNGGLGYLQQGVDFETGAIARVKLADDVIPNNPDWLLVSLGINEQGKTPATVQAEVTNYYQTLFAALPNVNVTVIGPMRAPNLNPSQAVADAIKAGVAAQPQYKADLTGQLAYFDTYAENWQQTSGGNNVPFIGGDGIHPSSPAGMSFISGRIVDAVRRHATALAA